MPKKLTVAELRRRQSERNAKKRQYNAGRYVKIQAEIPKESAAQTKAALSRDGITMSRFINLSFETYLNIRLNECECMEVEREFKRSKSKNRREFLLSRIRSIPPEMPEILKELRRQGVNLNQLTRAANKGFFSIKASKATPDKALAYITNPAKAVLVSRVFMFPNDTFAETARRLGTILAEDNRKYYHCKLSFAPTDNVTPEQALLIAEEHAKESFPDNESVIAVHTDTAHTHCHIIVNSVRFTDGRLLTFNMREFELHLNKYGVKLTRNTEKTISYLHPHRQKPVRGEKLGAGYTADAIRVALAAPKLTATPSGVMRNARGVSGTGRYYVPRTYVSNDLSARAKKEKALEQSSAGAWEQER